MKKVFIVLVALVLSFSIGLQVAQAGQIDRLLRELEIQLEKPGFGREFYVCASSDAFHSMAVEKYQPYADGVPRLYSTIANAYTACVANRGDTIYVLSGHSETLASALNLAKADVSLIGIGPDRPTLRSSGSITTVSITANNVLLKGIELIPGTTDGFNAMLAVKGTTAISVDNVVIDDVVIIAALESSGGLDTITLNHAENLTVRNCQVYSSSGSTYAPATLLDIQGVCTNVRLNNVVMQGYVTTGGMVDDAAINGLIMNNCIVAVTGTSGVYAATLDSDPMGIASYCTFSGHEATTRTNANLGINMAVVGCKIVGGSAITSKTYYDAGL